MPTETGIWTEEDAKHHCFDYSLAKFIGEYLPKKETAIDFGCGKGTYLRYLHDIGFEDLHGVEGRDIGFEISTVQVADLTQYYDCKLKGNVICLEVGEHIPQEFLHIFLSNIIPPVTGKLILSWAVPGQEGIGHVSCRSNVWVINEIEKRGLRLRAEDTLLIRNHVSEANSYFRNTLMIFEK